MTQQNKVPPKSDKAPSTPPAGNTEKEAERQKAEAEEVAGRHKNDGQKSHTGRT